MYFNVKSSNFHVPPSKSMAEMLMEFHITLQGDFWWCRKNVVPLHL